jgi:hypothetical protein
MRFGHSLGIFLQTHLVTLFRISSWNWPKPESFQLRSTGKALDFEGVTETETEDSSKSGLPDGTFSNKISQFWLILEGLAMEHVGTCYVHLVYFTSMWYTLWPFGIFYGHLVYFVAIWHILWSFGIFFSFWALR